MGLFSTFQNLDLTCAFRIKTWLYFCVSFFHQSAGSCLCLNFTLMASWTWDSSVVSLIIGSPDGDV